MQHFCHFRKLSRPKLLILIKLLTKITKNLELPDGILAKCDQWRPFLKIPELQRSCGSHMTNYLPRRRRLEDSASRLHPGYHGDELMGASGEAQASGPPAKSGLTDGMLPVPPGGCMAPRSLVRSSGFGVVSNVGNPHHSVNPLSAILNTD